MSANACSHVGAAIGLQGERGGLYCRSCGEGLALRSEVEARRAEKAERERDESRLSLDLREVQCAALLSECARLRAERTEVAQGISVLATARIDEQDEEIAKLTAEVERLKAEGERGFWVEHPTRRLVAWFYYGDREAAVAQASVLEGHSHGWRVVPVRVVREEP